MGGRQLNADVRARMVYVVHVPQGYIARFDRKGVSPLPEEMEKQSPPEKRASSAEGKGKDGGGDRLRHTSPLLVYALASQSHLTWLFPVQYNDSRCFGPQL